MEVETMMQATAECVEEWEAWGAPVAVKPLLENKFRIGFPLAAHALNHAATGLDVFNRRRLVAASCGRVCLENALSCQWVLLTHNGERTLLNHMEAQYLTRVQRFSQAANDPEELADLVMRQPALGQDRSWSVQAVFRRFSDTELFYDIYRDLSGAIHPGYATLTAHLDINRLTQSDTRRGQESDAPGTGEHKSGKDVRPRISRVGAFDRGETTATALALGAVLALAFLERCMEGTSEPSAASRIADKAGLPYDLAASDQNPERQHPETAEPSQDS